ncbi:metallophosphoesterase [Kaistella antarctica]|uniref:Bis(5'-nucleosyl)-tetraphosphatase prpE [asymmetrical] n=1 Tax=Kaistella antarctica TaxID=266748 RepID=A0A448NMG1_9FLAO|nr:metallophosphoesterase [Kaistella antarctica]SEV93822.1 Calcineurin-like phosphoesterase [Kaistella antarctica]VEH95375.1 Bis(5'-nucleosyl)-tetraphosphatase prpE [asymmetrical] [Kaistella antarctica]
MIDFIGDIHGHADKLEELLQKLGYSKPNNFYVHSNPNRTVLFVGDYIDRGPKIRETLEIVKSMVDNGSAIALMGNHEYNALCFHYQETDGGHLRKHLIKNIVQHYKTLKQFQNRQVEYEAYLEWFKTLPLFYETKEFRAVHACWDEKTIDFLKTKLVNNRLTDDLIIESVKKGTELNEAIEQTLKGKEIELPQGLSFDDKDGTNRNEIRIKWWEDPAEMTYRAISVEPLENLPETKIDLSLLKSKDFYNEEQKPVFFGHYWLKGKPLLKRENICCLDYSVAKEGYLVAYSFDGEHHLTDSNLTFVSNSKKDLAFSRKV